jgi:hypothetical protein
VLSVCLDFDPARQVRRTYRVVLQDLVKDSRQGLEALREQLSAEAARAEAWLEKQDPGPEGGETTGFSPPAGSA